MIQQPVAMDPNQQQIMMQQQQMMMQQQPMQMGQQVMVPMMVQPGQIYQDPIMIAQPIAIAPLPQQVVTNVTADSKQQDAFVDKKLSTDDLW